MLERKSTRAVLFALIAATLFAGAEVACAGQDAESRPTRVVQMVNVFANLEKTIDAKKSKAGDPVAAKVTVGSTLSDGTVVPTGSVLSGHIDSITPAVKKGDSILVLTLDKIAVKDGKEIRVKAVIVRVESFASNFGQEQANNDPDANRPAAASDQRASSAGMIDHPPPDAGGGGPHPIAGLTLSGSANDASSGTLTQAKKNIHLTNNTQLVVSVAVIP